MLATDVQQGHNIYEAYRPLTVDPAMKLRIERAKALQLPPEILFNKGSYVPQLDPYRFAPSPPAPAPDIFRTLKMDRHATW